MFLIFSVKSTLIICGISITKLQILIMPRFVVKEYKIQRASIQIIVFYLYNNIKPKIKTCIKIQCDLYSVITLINIGKSSDIIIYYISYYQEEVISNNFRRKSKSE